MKSVDLRSDYEAVYNQGASNACGPYACCAALDCVYERATGTPVRFDPLPLWESAKAVLGMAGTNTGTTFQALEAVTRLEGVKSSTGVVKGLRLLRTRLTLPGLQDVKNLLCMGFPVLWELKVTQGLHDLASKANWRTHSLSGATGAVLGQHFACIVGYDDDAGRFLVENSWGPQWADGGFFGVEYASMLSLTESMFHFNELPVEPTPVPGFTLPAMLLTVDKVEFSDRVADKLLAMLRNVAQTQGLQAVVDTCVQWGVSDKHLEAVMHLPRGTVRRFRREHTGIDWAGFVFVQI